MEPGGEESLGVGGGTGRELVGLVDPLLTPHVLGSTCLPSIVYHSPPMHRVLFTLIHNELALTNIAHKHITKLKYPSGMLCSC